MMSCNGKCEGTEKRKKGGVRVRVVLTVEHFDFDPRSGVWDIRYRDVEFLFSGVPKKVKTMMTGQVTTRGRETRNSTNASNLRTQLNFENVRIITQALHPLVVHCTSTLICLHCIVSVSPEEYFLLNILIREDRSAVCWRVSVASLIHQ